MDSQTIGLEGTIAVVCSDPLHRTGGPALACPGPPGALPPLAHLPCSEELWGAEGPGSPRGAPGVN